MLMSRNKKQADIQIIEKKNRYRGFLVVNSYQLRFRRFDGEWSDVIEREIIDKSRAVGVLPYDPIKKQVVLIEQLRMGALSDEVSPWMIEIVAGLIEPGESEEDVAYREMEEESGIIPQSLTKIGQYWVSSGCSDERCTLYCAEVEAKNAGKIFGVAEEHEDIRVHVVSVEQAFEWLDTGVINNASAIIALQWLRHRLA